MALDKTLNRRVKPRADVPDEVSEDELSDDSSPSIIDTGDADGILSSSDGEGDGDDSDDQDGGEAQEKISSISFGTLARAQDTLSRKRKRGSDSAPQQEDKLDALRARLREIRETKSQGQNHEEKSTKKRRDDSASGSEVEQSDSDEAPGEEQSKSRSSKHAPGSQTTKRQVTRKRTVVDVPKRHVRDPRFGPMSGYVDETRLQKNYAFLDDYQASEMAELKTAIKKTKDEDERETLKRSLLSMESRKKSKEAKERQQEVLREHRRKEKQAIKDGKNPFYLKKSDQKQLAMVEKFNSMKGKDREKLMERRRKKAAGKEKKNMPRDRRVVG